MVRSEIFAGMTAETRINGKWKVIVVVGMNPDLATFVVRQQGSESSLPKPRHYRALRRIGGVSDLPPHREGCTCVRCE